jgi:crotonobetainyl-CoA:carnitine CoA-transferase CaiB-like acyl-CoA transferase
MGSGMWLLIGILGALYRRHQTGEGAKVSNSLLETGVTWSSLQLVNYIASGKVPGKNGTAMPMIAPYEAFKAKDDWVMIAAGNDRLFENLCRALQIEQLVQNEKFKTNAERVKNRTELHQFIEERTQIYTVDELISTLRQHGVPCGPINTLDKVYRDEQVKALGMIKAIDSFRISDYKIVDLPVSIDNKRAEIQSLPPELGEHTEDIMQKAGYSNEEIASLRSAGIIQ